MEVIKRAKGFQDGEIVAWNENPKSVKEEVLRRNAKAGYCTKYGESPHGTKIQTMKTWGEEKLNIWPRDKDGKLIGD